jgi:hypothetical protein
MFSLVLWFAVAGKRYSRERCLFVFVAKIDFQFLLNEKHGCDVINMHMFSRCRMTFYYY